jgi:hypothetical protein
MREAGEGGRRISWSGFLKRASSWAAVWERGERARFLRGRLERGSAEVGMLSGICSDMVEVLRRTQVRGHLRTGL